MLEKNLAEFAEVLSTKEPVPGGGGASAYVASLGIALGQMVGSLTVGKKKYADVEDEIIALNEKAAELRNTFQELVVKDAEAFYPLSQAYGMPKETEEQVQEKERVLQAALVDAAKVPLQIARVSVEALELVDTYSKKGSVIAISDAGCAAAFLKASLNGARLNVMINTKLMKDPKLKDSLNQEIENLYKQGNELADAIYTQVANKLV